ncbi:glycosyltransferase family 2 protein [Candidatus Uhrbacteria bacterium]|nr:glycosyltransferase family 2 protein [Candidatus Uhrbacteria bacterium]
MTAKLTLQLSCYNGSRYLPPLFRSLGAQTLKNWRLLVLDNASRSEEAEEIARAVRESGLPIELFRVETNIGFAGAHNLLFEKVDSEFVQLLNDDAFLEPEYLERLTEQLDSVPDCAAVSGRIYRWDFERRNREDGGKTGTLDTVGLKIGWGGKVEDMGSGRPVTGILLPAGPMPVFGVSGCLPMYRTAAVRACHPEGKMFDQTYRSYKEDVDLAFRLRAGGFGAHTVNRAVAYHRRSIGKGVRRPFSEETAYLSFRNHFWMMSAHFNSPKTWIFRRPDILAVEMAKTAYWAIRCPHFLKKRREDTERNRDYLDQKRDFIRKIRDNRPADCLEPAETDVAVIMVSHNDLNSACLESLKTAAETGRCRIRLVVADNASVAYRANELVESVLPGSYCLMRDGDHGYGRSCNRAALQIEADYYFILNPDTVLNDPKAIDSMVDYLKAHPKVGMVGPKITDVSGETVQDTCRRFPTWYQPLVIRSGLKRTAWGRRYADRFLMRDYDHRSIRPVEWIQGSAMMLPRSVWKRLGGFDDRFWLYFEDVDLCRRTWLSGRDIHYLPEVTIRHAHSRESAMIRNPLLNFLRKKETRGHIASWIKYLAKWAGKPSPTIPEN